MERILAAIVPPSSNTGPSVDAPPRGNIDIRAGAILSDPRSRIN